MRDLTKLTDGDLKVHALVRLGFGAIPIENWGCFFALDIAVYPGDVALMNRAFSIWVPTMLDYINGEPGMARVKTEVARRDLDLGDLFDLAADLGQRMRGVLGLLSRDEQIFLRDRRLQNVHGSLEYFIAERPSIKWYDSQTDRIIVTQIDEADLHYTILEPFNRDTRKSQHELRERVVASRQWSELFELYRTRLTGIHIKELTHQLGTAPN